MEVQCACPYCGEEIELYADGGSGRTQPYVEDCSVCCRPIEVSVWTDESGEPAVSVQRGD